MAKSARNALFAAVICTCLGSAQTPGVTGDDVLLARIRAHMGEILSHTPNYTCVETMERTQRAGPAHQFSVRDTLRLEVALVDGKEMFAWPGSKKFESDDLRTLISTGAFGNGSFALFANAVFRSSVPTFTYRGEERLNGKQVVHFDFHVSRLVSGYTITVGSKEGTAGYHGSFWADRNTLEATRLEIIAEEIPANLGIAEAADKIDYARARIGDEEFLLPSASELTISDVGGGQSRNYLRFTGCKQYTGESVLRFDDPVSADPAAKPADEEIVLPTGIDLVLELADDVDSETVAAGDAIHATLAGDVKRKGKMLAPKGAVLLGRITRVQRYPEFTALGLQFTDLYTNGKHAGVEPVFDSLAMGSNSSFVFFSPARDRPVPVLPTAPHEALLRLKPGHVVVRRGILMYWRT